jgi:hypothetical protein
MSHREETGCKPLHQVAKGSIITGSWCLAGAGLVTLGTVEQLLPEQEPSHCIGTNINGTELSMLAPSLYIDPGITQI